MPDIGGAGWRSTALGHRTMVTTSPNGRRVGWRASRKSVSRRSTSRARGCSAHAPSTERKSSDSPTTERPWASDRRTRMRQTTRPQPQGRTPNPMPSTSRSKPIGDLTTLPTATRTCTDSATRSESGRLYKDLGVDSPSAIVGPFAPTSAADEISGQSTFIDPDHAPLSGHFHVLRTDAELPPGLGIHADGADVGGRQSWGHRLIYPTEAMTAARFCELVEGLDWTWQGFKNKKES